MLRRRGRQDAPTPQERAAEQRAPQEPAPERRAPEEPADERRWREAGGPEDVAQYACTCGYVWQAAVSASVGCPHCGAAQAW
jgi:hypothetical protein